MSNLKPAISLTVDLSNPGQFLACCGLFELASRIDADTLAWFDASHFYLATDGSRLESGLLECNISARALTDREYPARFPSNRNLKSTETIDPIILGAPFNCEIDWWLAPFPLSEFKTWSGDKQVPVQILESIQGALQKPRDRSLPSLWLLQAKLRRSPFYFAVRRPCHPVDIGFSTDKVRNLSILHWPLRELAVFVALQRFRTAKFGEWYRYRPWTTPIPINIAAAAACAIQGFGVAYHEFQLAPRDTYGHRQFSDYQRSNHD
ncbi:MAG: hypothetical protein WD118_08995 [Phycisphaeraceae bacterium]